MSKLVNLNFLFFSVSCRNCNSLYLQAICFPFKSSNTNIFVDKIVMELNLVYLLKKIFTYFWNEQYKDQSEKVLIAIC